MFFSRGIFILLLIYIYLGISRDFMGIFFYSSTIRQFVYNNLTYYLSCIKSLVYTKDNYYQCITFYDSSIYNEN